MDAESKIKWLNWRPFIVGRSGEESYHARAFFQEGDQILMLSTGTGLFYGNRFDTEKEPWNQERYELAVIDEEGFFITSRFLTTKKQKYDSDVHRISRAELLSFIEKINLKEEPHEENAE